jgi:ABC-type nitrate/sulfonate/bicarbonate transport system ATPase subunit
MYLDVRGLQKSYVTHGRITHVLGGVDLGLDEGEFVAIVGYSGCGKTTLVSLLAGLLAPDAGEIVLDGVPVMEPGPERSVVFQQYSLLPWMTVYENVALAVDAVHGGATAAERRRLTDELIALVNLTPARDKRPRAGSAWSPSSSCWTSRSARWTRSRARRCRTSSRGSGRRVDARWSSSPTTSTRRSCSPTGSTR